MTEQPPPYPQQPGQPWQPPQQAWQPPPGGYAPVPPTHGKATAALVLGILSFVLCGPFTGIPAIFVGLSARREIDASQGRLGGRSSAVAGLVLGVVNTVIAALGLILFIIVFVIAGITASSFDENCTTTSGDDSFSVNC